MNKHPLKVLLLDPAAVMPKVGHPGEDNAYDICSAESAVIRPGEVITLRTGFAASQEGFGFLIIGRSSSTFKGLEVLPTLVDSGYRGEWHIAVTTALGVRCIRAGERIAQAIPLPVEANEVISVASAEDLGPSKRRSSGFGSTGKD